MGRALPVFSYMPPAAFLWKALLILPHHLLMLYFLLLLLAILSFGFIGISVCGRKGVGQLSLQQGLDLTATGAATSAEELADAERVL